MIHPARGDIPLGTEKKMKQKTSLAFALFAAFFARPLLGDWPKMKPPEWWDKWAGSDEERHLETDYARQAIGLQMHRRRQDLLTPSRDQMRRALAKATWAKTQVGQEEADRIDQAVQAMHKAHKEFEAFVNANSDDLTGGLGLCETRLAGRAMRKVPRSRREKVLENAKPAEIFTDKDDPAYRQLLAISRSVSKQMLERRLYPVPDWRPTYHYLREMKHYGALPESFDLENDPVDPFEVDDAYFRLFYPGGRRCHEGIWKARQNNP